MSDKPDKLVRVEKSRGRVSLGRLVPDLKYGDMFRVEEHGDQIILTKVRAIPLAAVGGGGNDNP